MRIKKKSPKKEKSAMSISLYGNLFFVIIEIIMAIYTASQAVLLDGIYDGIEFFMLLPSIFLIPLLYKPATERHPYGYMQFESIFLVLKGATMCAVTFGIIINNIIYIIHGGRQVHFDAVAFFELSAAIIGILVTLALKKKNKALGSPLIQAEMIGWKLDSFISLGMAAGFFLPLLLPFKWFDPIVPYLDPIFTVILSLVMLPAPIKTVVTAFKDLMLLPPNDETVEDIKKTVEPFIALCKGTSTHFEIVKTGRKIWISAYVSFEKDRISISNMKAVQTFCIEALREKYSNFYFELQPEI